jgi:hypothetical protein
MPLGDLEPWQIVLGTVVVLIAGIQTWWDFAEGRVQGPLGTLDRNDNSVGFWWVQIGRMAFVVIGVIMIVTSVLK